MKKIIFYHMSVTILLFFFLDAILAKKKERELFHYAVGSQRRFERYYFENITEKLYETTRECSFNVVEDNVISKSLSSHSNNNKSNVALEVEMIPPELHYVDKWSSIHPPVTIFDDKVCHQASKFFKMRNGCSRGVNLHPDCPRCHRDITEYVTCKINKMRNNEDKGKPIVIPFAKEVRENPNIASTSPFIIHAKKGAYVTKCGGVAVPCGTIQTRTQCGTVRDETSFDLWNKCYKDNNSNSNNISSSKSNSPCNQLKKYSKLFVLSYKYDSAIGHFLTEILPRVAYYHELLTRKDDPVYIHYGCDKKFGKFSPPLKYMEWLGIDSKKFIQGEVYADHVMLPRDGACQDLLYNRWEYMKMREMIFNRAGLDERKDWKVEAHIMETSEKNSQRNLPMLVGPNKDEKPIVLVLGRSKSKYSARKGDITRLWPMDFYEQLLQNITKSFPNRIVVPFSDRNVTLMSCITCQIELFSRATLVIGMHGAGLSNMMFMPTGGTVIEICPGLDGRMLPASGPFSRLAMATGMKHIMYHLTKETMQFSRQGTRFDISRFIYSIKKFLNMIE